MSGNGLWIAILTTTFLVAGCASGPAALVCDGPCACATDNDCAPPTPRCDKNAGDCVPCLPKNDNCASGARCVDEGGSYACVTACTASADCPSSPTRMPEACCGGRCLAVDGDPQNCGGCGTVCTPPVNGTPACRAGVCGLGACVKGYADCDQSAADGCETKTDTDGKNCGACGNYCVAGQNQSNSCVAGACAPICAAGYVHCSMNPNDGCEVHSDVDLRNCGGCGMSCGLLQNATPVCTAGRCAIAACTRNFADCNANAIDGCEANLLIDVNHCGGCATACAATAHSTSGCMLGACGIAACDMGYSNCDGLYQTGCESNTSSDTNNCGGCNHVCAGNQCTEDCENSQCTITACKAGYADCDHLSATGCEVSTHSDLANCGGCGRVCVVPPNAVSAICDNAVCGIAMCKAGYADCNKQVGDGCEVDLTSSLMNCGACNAACAPVANAVLVCQKSLCGIGACNAGWADCDLSPVDGCEASTDADPNNCGGCGNACGQNVPRCVAGKCVK